MRKTCTPEVRPKRRKRQPLDQTEARSSILPPWWSDAIAVQRMVDGAIAMLRHLDMVPGPSGPDVDAVQSVIVFLLVALGFVAARAWKGGERR